MGKNRQNRPNKQKRSKGANEQPKTKRDPSAPITWAEYDALHAAVEKIRTDQQDDRRYTKWMLLATIAAVVIALGAASGTIWQAVEVGQANDLSRQAAKRERAYMTLGTARVYKTIQTGPEDEVGVPAKIVGEFGREGLGGIGSGDRVMLHLAFMNSGRTPAVNVALIARMMLVAGNRYPKAEQIPDPYLDLPSDWVSPEKVTINGAGQIGPHLQAFIGPLTTEQATAVRARESKIIVYGMVGYRDVIDPAIPRRTVFCLEWNPMLNRMSHCPVGHNWAE
jgi:hypothetical protein